MSGFWSKKGQWLLFGLWLVAVILTSLYQAKQHTHTATPVFVMPKTAEHKTANPIFYRQNISSPSDAPSVHAASLTLMQDQRLMATWFSGAREGASDVQILASHLSLTSPTATWSKPYPILDREQLSKQSGVYIKKLGNPVIHQAQNGTLHLFVVGVSLGGWAGSRIYHLTSQDGHRFLLQQSLHLSPFLNISHLVRATPVDLADGGFYLPIYHEFAHKFELLLRFDAQGRLIQKTRPNTLNAHLQPWLTPINDQECLSVRRNRKHSPIWLQKCQDGGYTWQTPTPLDMDNQDNSLNIVWFNHRPLIIHNQSHTHNKRHFLVLSLPNADKPSDHIVLDWANSQLTDHSPNTANQTHSEGEVSYPTTKLIGDNLHIVYTHDRKHIRHLVLNQAWLETTLSSQGLP